VSAYCGGGGVCARSPYPPARILAHIPRVATVNLFSHKFYSFSLHSCANTLALSRTCMFMTMCPPYTLNYFTLHWTRVNFQLFHTISSSPSTIPALACMGGGGGGSMFWLSFFSLSTTHTLHISTSPSDLHFTDTRYSTFVLLMRIVCWGRFSYLPTSAHSLRLYVNIFRPSWLYIVGTARMYYSCA
jgi:hypothetical protein